MSAPCARPPFGSKRVRPLLLTVGDFFGPVLASSCYRYSAAIVYDNFPWRDRRATCSARPSKSLPKRCSMHARRSPHPARRPLRSSRCRRRWSRRTTTHDRRLADAKDMLDFVRELRALVSAMTLASVILLPLCHGGVSCGSITRRRYALRSTEGNARSTGRSPRAAEGSDCSAKARAPGRE